MVDVIGFDAGYESSLGLMVLTPQSQALSDPSRSSFLFNPLNVLSSLEKPNLMSLSNGFPDTHPVKFSIFSAQSISE